MASSDIINVWSADVHGDVPRRGRVITLKFAGHEVVGLVKDSNPERTAERLLIGILKDESAKELKRILR